MLTTLLRNLLRGQPRSRQRQGQLGRGTSRTTFKPALEALEDRQLMSASCLFAPSAVTPGAVWYSIGSTTVYEQLPGVGGALLSAPVPNNGVVVQVSAGKARNLTDAAFVRDNHNNVWEYFRINGKLSSLPTLMATGAAEISGSAVYLNTVFVRHTDGKLTEDTAPYYLTHVTLLPANSGVTQISAGKDGAGNVALFANFSGAVYEHNAGLTVNNGWSYVAGFNIFTYPSLKPLAISDMSASQVQGDTVFLVKYSGSLSEYVGQATGSNTPLSYTAFYITSGVSQVSAGRDSSGHATAFALAFNGSLDEYTYHNAPTDMGSPPSYYFSKTHVADYADHLAASQIQSDTVDYSSGWPYHCGDELEQRSNQGTTVISLIPPC